MPADHWIDYSDADKPQPNGYDPNTQGLNIHIDVLQRYQAARTRVPKEYGPDFQYRARGLVDYGAAKAHEGLQAPRGSTRHIKYPER